MKEKLTFPFLSVFNCGKKNAVSLKFLRAFICDNCLFNFSCPDFVVIITTPFAALAPYKEVAANPFKTDIFTISFSLKLNLSTGTPSTIYNTLLLPLIEAYPLIITFFPEPEVPL